MKLFGLTIWQGQEKAPRALSGVSAQPVGSGGWLPLIRESFATAWQRNVTVSASTSLTYSAVFRCISLISSDVAKLRIRLVALDAEGIWKEVDANSPFWPVLRKPNRFQNRIQFFQNWMESKLIHGNTYVLKERDARGIVTRLYVLDPTRVTVLVADDGAVYYELHHDNLTGLMEPSITVPASEIIHDRGPTLAHPLVGTSPITAAGLAALQGLRIQENSATFFAAGANPGGVLTAPSFINDETARRLKEYWDSNYASGGPNVGKVAVLGDGLKYEPLMMSATDSQLLEQLKWTAETVASVFGVPAHMIGIGNPPTYNNIEALNSQYYSQCLQVYIESIELCLDEGLELGRNAEGKILGTEFDIGDLLRMDSATQMKVVADGVMRGVFSPNEGRFRFNLPPVAGGESPYMQEQVWPLRHLAERPLPSRPVTPPEEIEDDGDTGAAPDEDRPAAAEDDAVRSVNVVDLAERRRQSERIRQRLQRRAAELGRQRSS